MTGLSGWWEVARSVEESFAEEVRRLTRDMWKEDTVTINLLRRARDVLQSVSLDEPTDRVSIAARLYKADGKHEETYGDAGVLVRIEYRDGHVLDGVAFYEAKVRDWTSPKIPQAKRPQLQRMHDRLWHGHLVVFDRERVESRITGVSQAPWWWERRMFPAATTLFAPVTHVMSMPLGPILQARRFDTSIYKFGTPWSSQLVLRNLQGFDLDHAPEHILQSAGYSDRMGVPRHVLALGIKHGPGDPVLPNVNQERLRDTQDVG